MHVRRSFFLSHLRQKFMFSHFGQISSRWYQFAAYIQTLYDDKDGDDDEDGDGNEDDY